VEPPFFFSNQVTNRAPVEDFPLERPGGAAFGECSIWGDSPISFDHHFGLKHSSQQILNRQSREGRFFCAQPARGKLQKKDPQTEPATPPLTLV
jgi:hypothetical protein